MSETGVAVVLAHGAWRLGPWWADHDVFQRTHGVKRFHHPVVGDLSSAYEALTRASGSVLADVRGASHRACDPGLSNERLCPIIAERRVTIVADYEKAYLCDRTCMKEIGI